MPPRGIYAPITTPFDRVTGEIDLVAMRRNVRALIDSAPLTGFVLFGTTGEGPLIDEDERAAGIEAVRALVEENEVLAAIQAESTRRAVRLAKAAANAGADAVLVAPPSFYRPQLTAETLRDHFLAIADASPVPVVLYQVPRAFVSVELTAGLVARLGTHANIVGIKDSWGDLQAMGELVATCDRDFAVLSGSGAILYGALEIGAVGGILAVADLAPVAACDLYRLQREGQDAAAGALQEQLARLHGGVVAAFGVPGVKTALDLLGMMGGPPRPPLRKLREREVVAIRRALRDSGIEIDA